MVFRLRKLFQARRSPLPKHMVGLPLQLDRSQNYDYRHLFGFVRSMIAHKSLLAIQHLLLPAVICRIDCQQPFFTHLIVQTIGDNLERFQRILAATCANSRMVRMDSLRHRRLGLSKAEWLFAFCITVETLNSSFFCFSTLERWQTTAQIRQPTCRQSPMQLQSKRLFDACRLHCMQQDDSSGL